jgi:hypothetical protein
LTVSATQRHVDVYIVITPEKKAKEGKKTHYRVAMVCKQGVKPFGPSLPEPALFRKGHKFREFLLTKSAFPSLHSPPWW